MDTFMSGNYWGDNEIYVDAEHHLYRALGLGKANMQGLFDKQVSKYKQEADKKKVTGNLSGDGMTLGGTYVIDKGGNIILEYQQKKFGDHPSKEEILKALNIETEKKEE
mmetsp:Transcript_12661/g.14521  ORF Transcript_12661/g.14521 Transcript_12661/m.14521 type:complete len:109 (-) Transcript_12661:705-1031(-)|eukprot:CAMPEP_0184023434 /NCGR_PEP_ID=MMETSP0954-20121128/11360_1 /TAXON_ID=627963 /ORGANISM="Aplanochytrium sp, Strain PBS07" /LENGTH=108 /DNA_ID=CAMNT_0026306321 /DNA_START=482 /DNA_END=808 /DNA_ORIENTATION=+